MLVQKFELNIYWFNKIAYTLIYKNCANIKSNEIVIKRPFK